MSISDKQNSILIKARKYINEKSNKIFINKSSVFLYLNSWDPSTLGYSYIKWKLSCEKSLFWFSKRYFLKLISVKNFKKIELYNDNTNGINSSNLIISWCKFSDFDENGNYSDRYFNYISKKNDDLIWLLISLDNKLPIVINNNIIICHSSKMTILDYISSLLNLIFKSILRDITKRSCTFFDNISSETLFANNIANIVRELNNKHSFSSVIQPYEAQPFQHAINNALSKAKNKVKSIGYLHSVLPALPTDLIYRKGAPDVLFVHGIGQIKILTNFLNWDIGKLRLISSIRYKKEIAESFSDWIFLPYNFNNSKRILFELESYFNSIPDFFMPTMKIRNHPAKLNSKTHIELTKSINYLLIKYKHKFSLHVKNKVSIFIGATASIVEALERKVEVIHITSDPIFEAHQSFIWEYLHVYKLTNYTYKYTLNKHGSYIYMGNLEDSLVNLIT